MVRIPSEHHRRGEVYRNDAPAVPILILIMQQAITKSRSGEAWEIIVRGRIDGNLSNQLESEIQKTIQEGAREIAVNLSESGYICSAGIRVLLQYYRQMKNDRKALWVTRPSAGVESILELTGFKDLIVEKSRPG
jgi:anti-anti-sigma factor